jgi:hypothetical protein
MAKKNVPSQLKARIDILRSSRQLSVFCSYAHADEKLWERLDKHFASLKKSGRISIWHDREIVPGADFAVEIDDHLATSDIVILLISPDFLSSDYCYSVEMKQALERRSAGHAKVLPIVLRPCDWQTTPIGRLKALPKDGKPATTWRRLDQAFLDTAKGLRKAVEEQSARPANKRPPRAVKPSSASSSQRRQPYA